MKQGILGLLVWCLFRILKLTWRVHEEPLPLEAQVVQDQGRPISFAHFHEDEWALLSVYASRPMNVMVSHSKDGDAMAVFLRMLGLRVARGSSSRGAVSGFRALLKNVKSQKDRPQVSLAVDGPRGPRRKVKEGVIRLADSLNSPLVIAAAASSDAWVFRKSWNRAFIPKPFARIAIGYGQVFVDQSTNTELIEQALLRTKKQVEQQVGRPRA